MAIGIMMMQTIIYTTPHSLEHTNKESNIETYCMTPIFPQQFCSSSLMRNHVSNALHFKLDCTLFMRLFMGHLLPFDSISQFKPVFSNICKMQHLLNTPIKC